MNGLLHRGRRREARTMAEEGLSIIDACGGLGACEVAARVAAAEAREADGDAGGARMAIEGALAALTLRAGKISDDAVRERYLRAAPGSARALMLARAWGVDG